jgi:hypothetical protein
MKLSFVSRMAKEYKKTSSEMKGFCYEAKND